MTYADGRYGALDIGTVTCRLLVADVEDGRIIDVDKEYAITDLGVGVDATGRLSEAAIERVLACVDRYLEVLARYDTPEHPVRRLIAMATSASRDAANGPEFAARLAERGVTLAVIPGSREAQLTFLGASSDFPGENLLVVDIGGGSTEFTLGEDERILGAVSLQMGAVRMNAQRPILKYEDYAATVEQCRRMIQRDAQGLLAFETKPEWVGVGGTMTTLGAMERAIPLFDAQTCEGMTMDLPTVAGWGRRLARMSMAERRQVPGLMAHRADIIPSGVAILEAAMREFSVNELRLSTHGNMDGYLKKKFQEKA